MPFSCHNWHVSSRGKNGGLPFFGEAAKSPPQSNSAGTLVPAEFNDEKIYFSASRPAWATSVSTTPLGPPPTPMAPIILPFTMIGSPPAAAVMPKESTVRPAPGSDTVFVGLARNLSHSARARLALRKIAADLPKVV